MNKKESYLTLKWTKRIKAINLLGGKCSRCGNDNIFCLEFHHIEKKEEKEDEIGFLIRSGKGWSIIEREIKKCLLLCANCHSEIHFKSGRGSKIKIDTLNDLNITKCSICGHSDENYRSLVFHHRNKKNKKFGISNFFSRVKTSEFSVVDLIEEIKKCDIVCRNCHSIKHSEIKRFEKFKNEITEKIKRHKEKRDINWDLVKKLKEDGNGICDIAKIIGTGKSTIHYIYHKV